MKKTAHKKNKVHRVKRKEGLNLKKFFQFFLMVPVVLFCVLGIGSWNVPKADASVGVNRTLNFQGRVVNKTGGTNVTDGNYTFIFKIYDASSNGTKLWGDETQNSIAVTNGIFQVALGSVRTFATDSLDFNQDNLWLDVTFNGENFGSRIRLSAVPYALTAEKVSGLTVTQTTGTLTVANGKTLTANSSATIGGTDGKTLTLSDNTTLATNSITLAGGEVITFTAANAVTFTTTGTTSVTLPTSGTLLSTAGGQTISGTLTISSNSSTGLTVGANGSTNPVLQIDSSAGSVATGLKIAGAATGGTTALTVIDSGADANLSINAKGSGTVSINGTATGGITLGALTTLAAGKALIITGGAGDPTATAGTVWYDSSAGKFKIVEGSTVKILCNTTDAGCGAGGSGARLDQITAATTNATIANGDNPIVWNFAPSTSGRTNFVFGSTTAAAGASTAVKVALSHVSGTEVNGLQIDVNGSGGTTTNGVQISNSAGTITNGLTFTGTFTKYINSTNFNVTNAGGVTLAGTITAGSGAIQITDSTGNIALTSGDGTGSTSSGSGMEVGTGGTGLLQGCSDGQVLKWDDTSSVWECGSDRATYQNKTGSNFTLSASTTNTNVTNMAFPVGANETWIFQMNAMDQSPTAADSKWAITAPASTTCTVNFMDVEQTVSVGTTACATSTGVIATDNAKNNMFVSGTIVTSGTSGNVQLQFGQGTASGISTIFAGSYVIAYKVSGADLAEVYYTSDNTVSPGTVVSIDPSLDSGVKKADTPYDRGLVGIISTKPGLVTGQTDAPSSGLPVFVALAGRVPVKVTSENGIIRVGDYLTSSSSPGIAMKATKAGAIVGQALTGFAGTGQGTIIALVKTSFSQGVSTASILPGLTDYQVKSPSTGISILATMLASPPASSSTLSEITTDRLSAGVQVVSPSIVTKDLVAGVITADIIRANHIEGLEILTNRIASLDSTIHALASPIAPISSESAVLGIETASISGQLNNGSSLSTPSGVLSLESLSVKGLATVSADLRVKGNGLVEGLLTVLDTLTTHNMIVTGVADFFGQVVFHNDVTVNGTLHVGKDSAGIAIVSKDTSSVHVEFSKSYETIPVITASLTSDDQDSDVGTTLLSANYSYAVTQRSSHGFTILLNKKAVDDVTFSWIALESNQSLVPSVSSMVTPQPSGSN